MTKTELKKINDSQLIRESIRTYAFLLRNECSQRGTKQLEKHWNDCCEEMIKRSLITTEDVEKLNS